VNKSQLVEALAAHYEGNKKAAAKALDAVVDTITREVGRGEKVAITGFGAFEKAMRQEKAVPHFRPGANLRGVVEGVRSLPGLTLSTAANAAAAVTETAARATGLGGRKKAVAKSETATRTPGTKATTQPAATADFEPPAQKEAAAKKAAAKAPAKKAPANKAPAKKTPAKTAAAEAPAAKAPAKKAPATKAPARTAPSKKAAATAPAKAAAKKAAAKKAPAKKATAAKTSAPAPTPAALADPPVPDTSSRPVLSVGPDTDAGTTPASSPAEASQPGQS
jgi:DNA-binding protein HU-beta